MARIIQVDAVIDAKEGDLRVWWVRNPPSPAEFYIVTGPKQAIQVLDTLADEDLKDERVGCNAGGLEIYEDDEWTEWYNDNGDDIDTMDREGRK